MKNNNRILQKAIDELKKAEPNIQYVLGVLETIIESELDTPASSLTVTQPSTVYKAVIEDPIIPDPTSRLEEIKRLSGL